MLQGMLGDRMLGDRHRAKVAVLLTVVLGVFFWDFGHRMDEQKIRYADAVKAPQAYRGREITISYSRVGKVEDGRFFLGYRGRQVEVVGHLDELRPGAIASVRGHVLPDRRLVLSRGHVHRGRRLKWYSGALTLLGGILFLAREASRGRRGRHA